MSNALTQQKRGGNNVAVRTFTSVKEMMSDPAVKAQIGRALPKHMTLERMMRIAISAVEKNPLLKECEPQSVGLSIIRAAEMGLEVDGWEGHLVPFKDHNVQKCQFIPDYKGLVKLCYQSELVLEIQAEVICENDEFDYQKGTDSFLTWKPAQSDRGQMLGAWAGAKMKGGGFPFIVMWRDEIMQHKAKSQSSKSSFSPWNKPESEPWMWRKTVVRSLCKFLPRSTQLLDLLRNEDEAESGLDGVLVAGETSDNVIPATSRSEEIARQLSGPETDATPGNDGADQALEDLIEEYRLASLEIRSMIDRDNLTSKAHSQAEAGTLTPAALETIKGYITAGYQAAIQNRGERSIKQ